MDRSRSRQSIGWCIHQWKTTTKSYQAQDRGDGRRWSSSLCHQSTTSRLTWLRLQDLKQIPGKELFSLSSSPLSFEITFSTLGQSSPRFCMVAVWNLVERREKRKVGCFLPVVSLSMISEWGSQQKVQKSHLFYNSQEKRGSEDIRFLFSWPFQLW